MSERNESAEPGQLKPIGELLGAAKSNAASGVAQIKGAVNPASGWSAERKRSFARKRRETADRKRREAGREPVAGGPEETILEVKGKPEPEPPAPQPTAKDIEGWAGLIFLGHALGASLVKIPELRLDKGEANELSAASMNVMRHYGTAILSEKTQDWLKFGMVAAAVYGPKWARAGERVRAAKASRAAKGPPPGMNAAGGFERPGANIHGMGPDEPNGLNPDYDGVS